MLRAISVRNYRSFADRAKVELRPITILLGRNSAGKSSITRLFPLLQQSLERGNSAPLLWSSPSIDFGRITDVINRSHPKDPFELTFDLEDHMVNVAPWIWQSQPETVKGSAKFLSSNVKFTAFLSAGDGGKTEYQHLRLSIDDDIIDVAPRGESAHIYLNGNEVTLKKQWGTLKFVGRRLFPLIAFVTDDKTPRFIDGADTSKDIISILNKITKGRRSYNQHPQPYGRPLPPMPFVPRKGIRGFLGNLPGTTVKAVDEKVISELFELLMLAYLPSIIESIGAALSPAFTDLSYIGPIRASGNRFYRERELSVEKIDDKGENLATYIGSLGESELQTFNEILYAAFGVDIKPHPVEGHISIDIGRPGDEFYDNLADVGFGFSQLLPLVAQIHANSRRRETSFRPYHSTSLQITAIEQPELHLHPAYQANLADLFVAAVRSARLQDKLPVIILETHSEALIGRLGELVVLDQIKADDIAVHFVEKNDFSDSSTIRKSTFNSDGMIENWPVGFFSARSL